MEYLNQNQHQTEKKIPFCFSRKKNKKFYLTLFFFLLIFLKEKKKKIKLFYV